VTEEQIVHRCYGPLAVVSDVDDDGVCPECRQRKEVLLCYIEASTTERCWDRGRQDAHKVENSAESSARGCITVQGLVKYAQRGEEYRD
jgi:hypothetical protein